MASLNVSEADNESSPYRCTFDEEFKYILLPVSYGLVFLLGLALNAVAMFIILFRTKRWKPNTIYMFNLTLCDTLYVLTLPFLVYYYADESDWPFGDFLCKLIRFLFYANLYGSILFLSLISLHRFLGVCHPVRSMNWISARRARLMSAGVWAAVLLMQAPILYFSRTRADGDDLVCHDTTVEELFDPFLAYSTAVTALFFVAPFTVVLVCNALMVQTLLVPGRVGGGASSLRSKRKSARMIIIVLATFMLCFLPFHVTRSLYYSLRYLDERVSCTFLEGASMAYKITRPLASANSCLDPILYFLAGNDFRSNLTKRKVKQRQDYAMSTSL